MLARLAIFPVFLFSIFTTLSHAEELNPVLGKNSDYTIRATDLDRLIAAQPEEVRSRLQQDPAQRINLVTQLLTQKAVASRARKAGFDKKPDVKEQLAHVIDDFIAREYLLKVVASEVTVPEDDLKKYYNANESKFRIPEKIKVRHIFVEASKELKPEEKEKQLAKAEALLLRIKKGEDFSKLARETSEDGDSAKLGGELGTVSPGGTSSDEFEKAAFSLKTGEISNVVTTPYGFHIIRVDQRTEKRAATFEEAREYIYKNLLREYQAKKIQEFMDQASRDAGLEVYTDRFSDKSKEGQTDGNQK